MRKSILNSLQTDEELAQTLATRFKVQRIHENFSQKELSAKAKVSISKIRRFEQEGKIQFLDLIKALRAIGQKKMIENFMDFEKMLLENANVDFLIKNEKKIKRKRVRK